MADLITNGRVSIFSERIEIDFKLPKYSLTDDFGEPNTVMNAVSNLNRNSFIQDNLDTSLMMDMSELTIDVRETADMNWFEKILHLFTAERLYKKWGKNIHKEAEKRKKNDANQKSVLQFFSDVKMALNESEIKDYTDQINGFLQQLNNAKEMGQVALMEELKSRVEVMKTESLLKAKKVKFLTEEQMVKLAQNSEKGIKIDYVKNFGRLIPTEVIKKKKEVDEWNIYDNYVIVHFDPQNKAHKQTEAEKHKDPILFGIISGSTNLYFVADWIDEYCDLTLEKAIEIINSKNDYSNG